MARRVLHQSKKRTGLAPGTLLYTGPKRTEPIEITIFTYNKDGVQEYTLQDPTEMQNLLDESHYAWINVTGVHDTALVEKIGSLLNFDALDLGDVVNTYQRPKVVMHEKYIFLALKMIHDLQNGHNGGVELEHISMFLGKNYVITFQEYKKDIFAPIRYRIRNTGWRLRNQASDYLAYAIIDTITDHYFEVLEEVGVDLEELEEQVLNHRNEHITSEIYSIKRELVTIRRAIVPLRELLSTMTKIDHPLIASTTTPFLRDVYDHTLQLVETVDIFRDMTASLLETHLSTLSNKMNEVMKVLTVIATIFIPLTFIAGIYGMNFAFMPELQWRGGYFAALGLMLAVALGMVMYFRKKKWF